jgi:hypothetical protein
MPSDASVQKELSRRSSSRPATVVTAVEASKHRNAWAKFGLRFEIGQQKVLAQDAQSPWWATLCARKQSCLEFHQYARGRAIAKTATTCKKELQLHSSAAFAVVDLGPSINMLTIGALNGHEDCLVTPCILPQSDFWVSLDADGPLSQGQIQHRCITGEECLTFQGFPCRSEELSPIVETASNGFLQDLAGNAFPSTCIASILVGLFFATEQRDATPLLETPAQEDVANALGLLKRARLA